MRRLYHNMLSPVCRKIRIVMAEKGLDFHLVQEDFVSHRPEFLEINPSGEVPVLIEDNGQVIPDHVVICEYLEDAYPELSLLGAELGQKVEVRRLTRWFDEKFSREVTTGLLIEKVIKTLRCGGAPNSAVIRASKMKMREHFKYITWLVLHRNWLAGDYFSYADIAAAAQISIIDYLGDINWDEPDFSDIRDWYARIKSRPCFRGILADKISGIIPPRYYAELDF